MTAPQEHPEMPPQYQVLRGGFGDCSFLQAMFEEILLKNMTLLTTVDELGAEVARLGKQTAPAPPS